MASLLRGNPMDINQVGVVLMGSVLGWFLMFAVRRYKVQWGAFASFMAIVFGVAVGSKIIHGHDTNERCIVAFVERKRPEDELRHHDVVPKEIDGVLTDVVETGRFMAIPLVQSMDENRTHRVRPASGGVSI